MSSMMKLRHKSRQKSLGRYYKICVIGGGHVGLVVAAGFAQLGHKVICVDSNRKKIQALQKNKIPFYEPELELLVKNNAKRRNLIFSSFLANAIRKSTVIFITVNTPSLYDGSVNLSSVKKVSRLIANNLNSYKLIVSKSTVPVQTGKIIKEIINRYKREENNFDIASNPEFLSEGKAVRDFFYPTRTIIGVESRKAETILKDIYRPLKRKLIVTDIHTAELIKLASNSFLATKISFINAISRVCDLIGTDVEKVALAMGMDKRIGEDFLRAGVGYGGSCLPKDVTGFIHISKKLGYDFNLLKEVKAINEKQAEYFAKKIEQRLGVLKGKKIAVLGISYKPDTDDIRFAPAITIIKTLLHQGAEVCLYDPQVKLEVKKTLALSGKARLAKNTYAAVKGSDCLCLITEWKEFKKLNFKKIRKLMNNPLVADGRNMFDRLRLIKMGFDYIGMGR